MNTRSVDDLGTSLLGRTRGAVLGLLLGRPDEEFYVRQVARLSGATLGPVQRELKLLAQIGILKCRESGQQLLYSADTRSPVHAELRSITIKTVGMADILRAALKQLEDQIQIAFLFGSFARGEQQSGSDVDLMVIGNTTVAAVARVLGEPQRRLSREINPTIYQAGEFASKLRGGHHFLNSVVNGRKIFLIGDQDELSRVAKERLGAPARDKPERDRRTSRRR
jgi:predicted nucleotidyltransferase